MKRSTDIIVSLVMIFILGPLLIVVALLVRVNLGSPVLFRQKRTGLMGKPFEIIKFRTMTNCQDADGNLLSDAERLTKFGRLLRSFSIDELPELWNVLRSDMSLVGPRPQLTEFLPLYSPEQSRRHEVRPGITGIAQINGRNGHSWDARFEQDIWYVDNRSFLLDTKILLMTIPKVLRRENVSQDGHATMERFRGNGE